MTEILERRAVISGIGQSAVGRRLGRGDLDLTVEASLAAIADAGLRREDIDGLATYPGGAMRAPEGFAGPGTPQVQDALRLRLSWHAGGPEGPGQISALVHAITAVATGLARHVLVYRTVTEATAQGDRRRHGIGLGGDGRARGDLQWMLPFHAYSAANWVALYAQRHMHEYGTTREQLGSLAISTRAFAALNPRAVYKDPLTMEQYLSARTISSPLGLYDCDVPCDGSTAIVVSPASYAKDAPRSVARVEAAGTAIRGRPSWIDWGDFTTMASRDAAAHLWSRTDLTPADVDCAQLYDGFSFITLAWLEAMGFCGRGESGAFVEGGSRIGPGGALPLNTAGGQLSGGRLHGYGFVHEACVQLRGEAGERQVPGARVAAVGVGGGPLAGALLLVRDEGR